MIETSEDQVLRRVLEDVLHKRILNLRRVSFPYGSSFAIEELELSIEDNGSSRSEAMRVVFKNLSRDAILADADGVKPAFLYDPLREINVYRSIHPLLNLGTPKLYGAIADHAAGRYWLFLERVFGDRVWELEGFEVWLEAARWLARFHASPAAEAATARRLAPELLEHDASYYETWLTRADSFVGPPLDPVIHDYERAAEILLNLPRTLIHGEFYPSNIMVQQRDSGVRICPLDWEMAAIAPGILDVAALASGNWTDEQRLRMAEAWRDALPAELRPPDLPSALRAAKLQIAVQWLGWSDRWSPPGRHAHDWLSDALRMSSPISSYLRQTTCP